MIMESTDSSTGSQQPQLPPGFRFHPTDEELVVHYLKKKATSAPLPVSIIAEVDLYKFDPWELPAKAIFGEQEWYFFSPRDRKYPNGARPNRAATSGYWKATGTDKPVLTAGGTQKVGVKKALVFYGGKPPKGIKTNWIMHEYRLTDNKPNTKPPGCDIAKKGSLRLDDWVLCRIYKKTNAQRPIDQEREEMNEMMNSINSGTIQMNSIPGTMGLKPYTGSLMDNEQVLYEGMMSNNAMNSHLAASSKLPLMGPVVPDILQGKRTLPNLYWNDQGSPPTKRFFEDGRTSDDNTNSMVSILSQLPQTSSVQQQQAMLGSLGDGVFRQPNQNHQQNHQQQYWYT